MKARSMFAAGAAAVLLAAPAAAQGRIDERRATPATGTVQVHNLAGSVRVVGWDRNEVHVTGTLGRGAERVEVQNEGGRLVVRVVNPPSQRGNRRRVEVQGTDLEVRVPDRKRVDVHTVSAEVEVRRVEGEVEAHSVSGGVAVTGSPRAVRAQSRSGEVRVDARTGSVRASSVSGEVSVAGTVGGRVEAQSVSGGVSVTAASQGVKVESVSGTVEVSSAAGRAEVQTVSGDIALTGRRLEGALRSVSGSVVLRGDVGRGGVEIESHSGDVELQLARSTSATVEMTTFSGGLENDFAGARITRASRREYRVVLGGGDARVRVTTFSGDVKLSGR
ncbi:MAG TPA: DUF4097 family beta strand repeat-containing protein [Longimicrobium sp.]|nr:DUF4097 family beta strand repeat-containing protein [Longimicrobium sp.]